MKSSLSSAHRQLRIRFELISCIGLEFGEIGDRGLDYHRCRVKPGGRRPRTLRRKSWKTRKRVLGAEHPDTLTSMNDLAHIFHRQCHSEAGRSAQGHCHTGKRRCALRWAHPKHNNIILSLRIIDSSHKYQPRNQP